MQRGFLYAALLGLGLAVAAPVTPARADDYPYQSRANFTLDGTVRTVDSDRDRLVVDGDDGHRYTIDTYRSQIALRDTDRAGETGDLVRGMRVRVTGSLLAQDIVEADRVRVLPFGGARPTGPVGGPEDNGRYDTPSDNNSINLRGTVESVDNRRGRFVVRVNTHERTVYVNDYTDLRGTGRGGDAQSVPLRPGDRVTVSGRLRDDGSVLAETISLGRTGPGDSGPGYGYQRDRQLTGRVVERSNRYTSRDIKVRVGPDRDVKVHVPTGIPIRRDGRPLSVHELSTEDVVRISGTWDGNDFKATRIEVVGSDRSDD